MIPEEVGTLTANHDWELTLDSINYRGFKAAKSGKYYI
jgi:hypothetical protein